MKLYAFSNFKEILFAAGMPTHVRTESESSAVALCVGAIAVTDEKQGRWKRRAPGVIK